jgi:hypothetical protein
VFGWFRRESEPVVQAAPQPEPVPEEKYDPRPPILRAIENAKAMKRRWLIPHEIALHLVTWLRNEGYCDYPYLSKDVDEQVEYWCDLHGVARPDMQQVREQLSNMTDDVRYIRERLNRNNPRHAFVIQRMEARGLKEPRNGWRMVLYYFYEQRVGESRECPKLPRKKQVRSRGMVSDTPANNRIATSPNREPVRERPAAGGDDLEIGWEIPDRRYA